jgi:predicted nucleic acid-binding Zn ribbon protein
LPSPEKGGAGRRGRAARSGEPAGIGAVLDELLASPRWRPGTRLAELAGRWDEVVGERLAQECRPVSLADGTLLVEVSTAAWAVQLRFLEDEIRRRATETIGTGTVRTVRVVVDRGPRGGAETGRP